MPKIVITFKTPNAVLQNEIARLVNQAAQKIKAPDLYGKRTSDRGEYDIGQIDQANLIIDNKMYLHRIVLTYINRSEPAFRRCLRRIIQPLIARARHKVEVIPQLDMEFGLDIPGQPRSKL